MRFMNLFGSGRKGGKTDVETLLTMQNLKASPGDVVDRLMGMGRGELYRSTLKIQNDLHVNESVRYLSGNRKWKAAKTVLDLGCGPGDLTAHLSGCFTDKSFTGVDLNRRFISIAKAQTKTSANCAFHRADLYKFNKGRYDFIILRAVLQHLKHPDRFMNHLPTLLNDGAAVLFLETTKENFLVADPPIKVFDEFYSRLEAVQKKHTGSRDCVAELEGRLATHGFKLIETDCPVISVTDAGDRVKAVQYLILACAVSKKMMAMPVDLGALIADLIHWHETEGARLSLRSRRMLIERV